MDGTLKREERRLPGTQCSQEIAVPVVNLGSSPPTNFLTLNCMASVLAPSPAEKGALLCEDLLCVDTVLPTLPPLGVSGALFPLC